MCGVNSCAVLLQTCTSARMMSHVWGAPRGSVLVSMRVCVRLPLVQMWSQCEACEPLTVKGFVAKRTGSSMPVRPRSGLYCAVYFVPDLRVCVCVVSHHADAIGGV